MTTSYRVRLAFLASAVFLLLLGARPAVAQRGAYTQPRNMGELVAQSVVVAACNEGTQSAIMFDADGIIFQQLTGETAIIGFSRPCKLGPLTGRILSGMAMFNGLFRDGINTPYSYPPNYELSQAVRPNVLCRVNLGLFGGTAPYSWTITTGPLPSGLNLNSSTGQIIGTPTTEGTSDFTVQVTDTGPPVQTTSKALSLTIRSDLGRNDSPATATPISNGTFRASISPYSDPVTGPANPDSDYYELTANPGAVVTVETMAKRLTPESPLDTVIEIVDAEGNRFSTCRTYTWDA